MNIQTLSKFKTLLNKKLSTKFHITNHLFEQLMKRGITKVELKTLLTETLKIQKSKSCSESIKLISSKLTLVVMSDGTIKTIYSQHNNL